MQVYITHKLWPKIGNLRASEKWLIALFLSELHTYNCNRINTKHNASSSTYWPRAEAQKQHIENVHYSKSIILTNTTATEYKSSPSGDILTRCAQWSRNCHCVLFTTYEKLSEKLTENIRACVSCTKFLLLQLQCVHCIEHYIVASSRAQVQVPNQNTSIIILIISRCTSNSRTD